MKHCGPIKMPQPIDLAEHARAKITSSFVFPVKMTRKNYDSFKKCDSYGNRNVIQL